ncbi:hypothetical protein U9M48_028706 [Paspalum notatum var. saurae]|uniref:C-terminal processing peptidase n=1 Tax=Paspalum notatum var. saurae TaxID=547442 RepID=A0AAQ3TX81_PASNO
MEMECTLAATLAPRPLAGRVRKGKAMPRPAVLAGRARLRVRSARREQPSPPQPAVHASGPEHRGRALGQAAAGLAAAAVVSLTGFAGDVSPLPTLPARAESLTVAFPVSKAREVNRVQRTLVEAWGLIRETFVDPTFNHQDWDQKLQQTMVEMFPLKSADAAYNKISGMLSTLGDPFTRIISPKQQRTLEEEKVWLASFHLEGVAQQWYMHLQQEEGTPRWRRFTELLNIRFGPLIRANPLGKLAACRRTGTVNDYATSFMDLLPCAGPLSEP